MTVYCIGKAKITNNEKFAEYKKYSGEALVKHDGIVVSASKNLINLDGNDTHYNLSVILSFPSENEALAWRNDETLTDVHALRVASGDWVMQILAPM